MQYFALAHNIHSLSQLQWTMLTSLLKTLSAKHKGSVNKRAKRYITTVNTSDGPRRCLEVRVNRKGKKPLIARFGGIPLARQPQAQIEDTQKTIHRKPGSTELIQRLLADTCEMCGSTKNCQVHHVKKLADIQKNGRRAKPLWMVEMIARRRKTLVVCYECHCNIHMGHPTASHG